MALTTVERPEEFGIVGLDEDGRIVRFKEKPRTEEVFSNLINAGIYVLEARVLEDIPAGEKYDFSKQLFPKLLERGERLFGGALSGLWKDIGRPRDLLDANLKMAERRGRTSACRGSEVLRVRSWRPPSRPRGARSGGPAYIGEGASSGRTTLLTSCAIGDQRGHRQRGPSSPTPS